MLGVTAKLTQLDRQRKNNAFQIFRPDPTRESTRPVSIPGLTT